jgi:hypothetical protein
MLNLYDKWASQMASLNYVAWRIFFQMNPVTIRAMVTDQMKDEENES